MGAFTLKIFFRRLAKNMCFHREKSISHYSFLRENGRFRLVFHRGEKIS